MRPLLFARHVRATTRAGCRGHRSWTAAAVALSLLAPAVARGDAWTRSDSAWESGAIAAMVVDWRQTAYIARRGPPYFERNPLLGERPRRAQVDFYFASSIAAHLLAARMLPRAYRRTLQLVTIGFEGSVVANNARMGIALQF